MGRPGYAHVDRRQHRFGRAFVFKNVEVSAPRCGTPGADHGCISQACDDYTIYACEATSCQMTLKLGDSPQAMLMYTPSFGPVTQTQWMDLKKCQVEELVAPPSYSMARNWKDVWATLFSK